MSISLEDFEAESKVYDPNGMTRLPSDLRLIMGIEEGDTLKYRIQEDKVVVEKKER